MLILPVKSLLFEILSPLKFAGFQMTILSLQHLLFLLAPPTTAYPGPRILRFLLEAYPLHGHTISKELLIKCHGFWQRANDSNSVMQTPFVNEGRAALKHTISPDLAPWPHPSQSLHFLFPISLKKLWLLFFLRTISLITFWFNELTHILPAKCLFSLKYSELVSIICNLRTVIDRDSSNVDVITADYTLLAKIGAVSQMVTWLKSFQFGLSGYLTDELCNLKFIIWQFSSRR